MKLRKSLNGWMLVLLGALGAAHAQDSPTLQLQSGHALVSSFNHSMSPTGALVATAGANGGVIKLWETRGGRLLCTLSPPVIPDTLPQPSHYDGARQFSGTRGGETLAWSSDGTRLLSTLGGNQLAVWDLRHCGKYTVFTLPEETPSERNPVRFLGTLAGNKVLVQSGRGLEVLQPFDADRGVRRDGAVTPLAEGASRVLGHSFDGRFVLVDRSAQGELSILDRQLNAVRPLDAFRGFDQAAQRPGDALPALRRVSALSRSGRWLALNSVGDGSILVYDTRDQTLAAKAGGEAARGRVEGLAFSADEKSVYVLREEKPSPQAGIMVGTALEIRSTADLKLLREQALPIRKPVGNPLPFVAGDNRLVIRPPSRFGLELHSVDLGSSTLASEVWSAEIQSAVGAVAVDRQGWLAQGTAFNRQAQEAAAGFDPRVIDKLSPQQQADLLKRRNEWFALHVNSWSMDQSAPARVVSQYTITPDSTGQGAFSADGAFQAMFSARVTGSPKPPVISALSMWQTPSGKLLWQRDIGESGRLSVALAVAPGGAAVASLLSDMVKGHSQLLLLDGRTGRELGTATVPSLLTSGSRLDFSADGKQLRMVNNYGPTGVFDVSTPQAPTLVWSKDGARHLPLGFLPGSGRLLMPALPDWLAKDQSNYAAKEFGSWPNVLRLPVPLESGMAVTNAAESIVAVAQQDRLIRLIDIAGTPRLLAEMGGMTARAASMAFSPDGRTLVVGDEEGGVWLWDVEKRKPLARSYSFGDGDWVVIDPQGRFDTNNLEGMKRLHWVMPDEPFRAYPLELFMRQYFQPQLLERILARAALPAVPSVASLNRGQPVVRIAEITPRAGSTELVDVTVKVSTATDFKGQSSGAADLRLFRDGQLVAKSSLADAQVVAQLQGGREATVRFSNIRLPSTGDKVDFSAYAFNVDRVKSATVSQSFDRPGRGARVAAKGRAFVVSMGVNVHSDPAWNLSFAAKDALKTQEVLGKRLLATGSYSEVVAVPLVSDAGVSQASKAQLRAVLLALSGQPSDPAALASLPQAARLKPATPDDAVFITFSGHGYTEGNEFYLVPQDIAGGRQTSAQGLASSISTAELTEWLEGIDAGDLALVIDACHSAAAVQLGEFKPGPMGAKGLGQLAYDKGIRVLAATQADDVALESGNLRQGLLTFALVNEGLDRGKADYRPTDRRIDVAEWLGFGVMRVPEIYQDVRAGRSVLDIGKETWKVEARGVRVGGAKPKVQKPTLFDFTPHRSAALMSVLD